MTELNPNFLSLFLYTRHLSGCNDKTQSWFLGVGKALQMEPSVPRKRSRKSVLAVYGWSSAHTFHDVREIYLCSLSLFPHFNVYLFYL